MAGTLPIGVNVPVDYDVTITSTTDDDATVAAAVGLKPAAKGEESGDEGDAGDDDAAGDGEEAGAEGADAGDDDDAGDEGEEPETPPARKTREVARVEGADYESPKKGESPQQRSDRIERNVKRIGKLNTKLANANQHIQTLTDRLTRLESRGGDGDRSGRGREQEPPAAPAEPKFVFPSWDDFAADTKNEGVSHEEYIDLRTDARLKFTHKIQTSRRNAAMQQEQTDALIAGNAERIETFKESHDDFDEVVAASKAPLTNTMHVAMMQRPWGPAIAYYCSSTPEGLKAAQRIAKLPPLEQIEELAVLARSKAVKALMDPESGEQPPAGKGKGKKKTPRPVDEEVIDDDDDATDSDEDEDEDDVEEPPARQTRRTSRAPKPLPIQAGSAQRTRELSELTTDDYIARQDDEDRKRGRRR